MKNKYQIILLLGLTLIGFDLQNLDAKIWTIDECVDSAMVYNKNLKINSNNIRISEIKRSELKSNLYPKLDVNFDYKYFASLPYQLMPLSIFNGPTGQFKEAQFGVPHNMSANALLTMPLYNASIYNGINATEFGIELNNLNYLKKEEELIFGIYNLYYNAQILNSQRVFVDSNIVNSRSLLKIVKLLEQQGMLKSSDVSKVELQLSQAELKKKNLETNIEQIINNLKFLIGYDGADNFEISKDISYEGVVELEKNSSLDFLIFDSKNSLLNSELKNLKQSKLPKIAAFANYGYSGFGYDEQPDPFLKFFPLAFVGIQGSISVLNFTTNDKIDEKLIEIENNKLQLDYIMEKNDIDMKNFKNVKQNSFENINVVKKQIELAGNIYKQVIIQQREGTAFLTDVLLADNALRQSQQEYVNAVVSYLKAELELKKQMNLLIKNNINYENEKFK